ncbi:MAG: outer membrane beta-barrel protein, partial [Prevotella sp.]|nr:outer membrane beta-barrel protein [Prevotella sp.]
MRKTVLLLPLSLLAILPLQAQTRADSLRADSIYKSLELQDVVVVKQKSLVKSDIDKLTYDIENDPDSKSNSVIEMLRKVPMVTVDGEDNIQVNGSSSFKVYVNGKPNNMLSNNPKDVLKSMPANSVKKIEVITNPGPKYDAEGVGGVLNIVTHGKGLEGYTATVSANASTQGAGGGAYATVKAGKLTVSANYNLSYNDSPRSYSGGSRKTTGTVGDASSDLTYDGSSKGHGTFQYGSLEASYEIDTLRLVTANFGLWGGGNRYNSDMTTQAVHPTGLTPLYGYQTASHSRSSWYSIDGGIDYQRSFSVPERLLTLSYKIDTNPETSDSYTSYLDKQADEAWDDFIERLRDQRNDGSQSTTEQTFQLAYTTPFAKLHKLEAVPKYNKRNNR